MRHVVFEAARMVVFIALLLLTTPFAAARAGDASARIIGFDARLRAARAEICGAARIRSTIASKGGRFYAAAAAHPLAPWMAQLQIYEGERRDDVNAVAHCGAVALTRDWLLTAAHCVGLEPWLAIEARLGAGDITDPRALRRAASIAICPSDFAGDGLGPDIALLRLATQLPADFPTLRVATADEMRRIEVGGQALSAGWRRRRRGVEPKLSAPLVTLKPADAEGEGVIVAAPTDLETSLCLGESGAPLVADLGLGPVLLGVFSSVDAMVDPQNGELREICAGEQARSYFTSVDGWQHWISESIQACDADIEVCVNR